MSNQKTKPYRPSSGTEGEYFRGRLCANCRKDTKNNPCRIIFLTMAYDVEDKKYPKQWVYMDDGVTCTAFDDKRVAKKKAVKKPAESQFDLFGGAV